MLFYLKRVSYLVLFFWLCITHYGFAQHVTFPAEFAPTQPAVTAPEIGFRDAISLNGSWQFYPVENAERLSIVQIKNPIYPAGNDWESTPVKVPSPWNVNSFATENIAGGDFVTYPSYPKKWENIRAGWLTRKLAYRKEWKNKRLIVRFDGVGGFTQVYLNKQKVAENFDVFLPFEVDITGLLKPGQENELTLWVADGRLLNKPGRYGNRIFVAGSFWGQHVRGIWQDVNLLVKPGVYVSGTFVQPLVDQDTLAVTVTINNTTTTSHKIDLTGSVSPWVNISGKSTIEAPEVKWTLSGKVIDMQLKNIVVQPRSLKTVTLKIKANGRLKQWEPSSPNLYGIIITPIEKGTAIDKQYTRFGWRQFTIAKKELKLNGKPIILKGDSWHFMGIPQMTRRYAWAWYTALKDANANAVRLHAQPYPAFYLDMADEMGICVLDETGMWASDGGPKVDDDEYWANSEDHLKRFILRDRNHPAVFGWSVCNENLAVTIGVLHSPDSIVKRQLAQINKWVAITRQLDPTRTWISGDGETNEPTDLPTVIGHYGDENAYKNWSATDKPWGIGEAGMAYYGTPKQTAVYNGNTSYQSQLGRMEGVANEAIKLLNQQKKYHASYNSIFNIVWYGLQPLELGLADTTRKVTDTDGVYFGPYVEGKGGVQPERLGPYTTTLNPGYDPRLPLYKKWPLFDAVQKSFAGTGLVEEPVSQPAMVKSSTLVKKAAYLMLRSADPDSAMYHIFSEMGLLVNKPVKNATPLLIIDGIFPPADGSIIKLKNDVLKKGGTVLIWGVAQTSIAKINALLPLPVKLTERNSTSFLTKQNDAILGDLNHGDFYFTELSNVPVARYGLTGPFVDKGKTILAAGNTDWGVWNKQAEYLKTAAILRSEREAKPAGNALVSLPAGKGAICLMALKPVLLYRASPGIVTSILANLGVSSGNGSASQRNIMDGNGSLNRLLFIDPFHISKNRENDEIQKRFSKDDTEFKPGQQVNGHTWRLINANADNAFNPIAGQDKKAAVGYYSFWIYTPRSLSNLLLEPDMPKIDLNIKTNNTVNLYINNKPLEKPYNAMPLEKGWNHIIIESNSAVNDWKIKVSLNANNPDFLNNDIKVEAYR